MADADTDHLFYRAEAALQHSLEFLREMPPFEPFTDGRDISLVYYRKEAVANGCRTVLDLIRDRK